MNRTLLDGPALAAAIKVSPATLRAWASAGLIDRHGRDRRGRTLYDVDQVVDVKHAGARGVAARRAERRSVARMADTDRDQLRSHPAAVPQPCPGADAQP